MIYLLLWLSAIIGDLYMTDCDYFVIYVQLWLNVITGDLYMVIAQCDYW